MLKRAVMGAALTVAAVTGTMFTGVSPASAVTCTGSACDGKSPTTSGCASSAIVAKTADLRFNDGAGAINPLVDVDLMYSTVCRTVWGRIRGAVPNDIDYPLQYANVYRNSDNAVQSCNAGYSGNKTSTCITEMLYDAGTTSFATALSQGSPTTSRGATASY